MSRLRWLRTVRHLRADQIANRLLRQVFRPRADTQPAPPVRRLDEALRPLPARPAVLTGPQTVRLFGEEGRIADAADWADPARERLWLYHLHYFDDLVADDAADRLTDQRRLVERWIEENPPGRRPAWEPYPTSRRIVNLVFWLLLHGEDLPAVCDSLAAQARWLTQCIEHHLRANHLLANAKALLFAGLFFTGEEADRWRDRGASLFAEEMERQILSDGGHEERSPMYHAVVLLDALDTLNLLRACGERAPAWAERIPAMLRWLATLTHPDGEIALFNDAAADMTPPPDAVFAYAERLGFDRPAAPGRATHLAASGYARLERGAAVVLADAAPLGPDHQPGHGHADTLTFELSLRGRRLVVDTGTATYTEGPERLRQRGTAAHNTVGIDRKDSSEVWAAFRVGRRARITEARLDERGDGTLVFTGAHDGYRFRGVRHRRTWTLEGRRLRILDELEGDGEHEVRIAFHLAHGVVPTPATEHHWRLALPDGATAAEITLDLQLDARDEATSFHPAFGAYLAARRLTGRARTTLPARFACEICWD